MSRIDRRVTLEKIGMYLAGFVAAQSQDQKGTRSRLGGMAQPETVSIHNF